MKLAEIRDALGAYDRLPLPLFGRRESAVLIPLFEKDGEISVLLTKRSSDLPRHAGEVSFPGGSVEPDDESNYAAALREAQEEVGVDPEACEYLGTLDDTFTVTGYRVTPHVALVSKPPVGEPSDTEVERVLCVPLAVFMAVLKGYPINIEVGGVRHSFPLFVHRGQIIWGATARILEDFVRTLRGQPLEGPFGPKLRNIARLLFDAKKVIISTHINPDPDGLGSEAAMEELLLELGKEVVIANNHPIPETYGFMKLRSRVYTGKEITPSLCDGADLFLALDTAERSRLGRAADLLEKMGDKVAVLDHHLEGDLAGDRTIIDSTFSSTSELVYLLLSKIGYPLNKRVVDALYAGIMFDTGSFRFIANRSRSLKTAAHLVDLGADASAIQEQLFACESRAHVKVLSQSIERACWEFDNRLVWSWIDDSEMKELDASTEDAGEISSFFSRINGVLVGLFMRDLGDGRYKLSLRSKREAPIGHICRMLGGGGHACAGGATAQGTPDEIMKLIRPEFEKMFG